MKYIYISIIFVLCAGGYVYNQRSSSGLSEIHVFSLKSGRSMFIRTADDMRILVDGGGNPEIIRHLTRILPFYSRYLDVIISTNTDSKNVTGLIDIIDRYDVKKVYIPAYTIENIGLASSTDEIYLTFIETIKEKPIELQELKSGDELVLGNTRETLSMKILFPVEPKQFAYSKASAPEILFSISNNDSSVLFMGDASLKVQKFIASYSVGFITDSNVLIVSHSAITSNISPKLIDVTRPEYLIYSGLVTKASSKNSAKKKTGADPLVGVLIENRFNLKEKGTVQIFLDGKNITIK